MYNFKKILILVPILAVFLFLNQNTSRLAAGMNGSQKNLPEGILRSLLRSSSFLNPTVLAHSEDLQGLGKAEKITSFLHDLADEGSFENYLEANYASVLEEKGLTAKEALEIVKKSYAKQALGVGFDVVNSRVRVVIEPKNNDFKLPEEFGVEETRTADGSLAQALVNLNKLEDLSEREDVKLVREPIQAVPLSESAKSLIDLVPQKEGLFASYLFFPLVIGGLLSLLFLGRFLKKFL